MRLPLPRPWSGALGLLCVAIPGTALAQNVQPPPLWYSGDTHEMLQLCPAPGGQPQPDRDPLDVYAEMLQKDLNFSDVLVLVAGDADCDTYLDTYAPLVTGFEDPITFSDPDHFMQFGCEAVGGEDPRCLYPAWGHVVGLGIQDAAYVLDADYPSINLDFFRNQPGAIAGYAHVAWPTGTAVPTDFPPINRHNSRVHPPLAPIDTALGKVDLISTPDVGHEATSITPYPWWGLYYKLLNAGLRVSLVGGTVAQCYDELSGLDARTYALFDADPPDHDRWIEAIRAGRTSIADGTSDFILLQVNGADVGSELEFALPETLAVEVRLMTAVPRRTTIEIIQDGAVVDSSLVDQGTAGTNVFRTTVSANESGWIAARTDKTHTAAVYVIVDDRPITDYAAAEYFRAFAAHTEDFLDAAVAYCDACPSHHCLACEELDRWVGNSEQLIRADIQEGERIFQALRDYELPATKYVERYGQSTPTCQGPMGIGIAGVAEAGSTVAITCFNGPPDASGTLLIGRAPTTIPTIYLGINLHVALDPAPLLIPTQTNGGGFAEVSLQIPPGTLAHEVYCQFIFVNPPSCPGSGAMSASDALRVKPHAPRFVDWRW